MTTAQDKALARRGGGESTVTLIEALRAAKPAVARFFAGNADEADRLIRVAYDACCRSPTLMKCSATSVIIAVKRAAALQLDLSIELGQAALVPRWNAHTKSFEAHFEIMYRGFVDIAMRSDKIRAIRANVVYAGDEFDYRDGLSPILDHRPQIDRPDGSPLMVAYAIADTVGGGQPFVVLFAPDVEKRRASSPSWRSKMEGKIKETVWDTHPEAMWRKSAIRALAAFLPRTLNPLLAQAVGQEEADEMGMEIAVEPIADETTTTTKEA